MLTTAIVRKPCPEMVRGLSTAGLGAPDYPRALVQHARYVDALKRCGLRVTILEADARFPDSTFVEDVAVCLPHAAVVTNPGAPSRNGEKEGMAESLRGFYKRIERIRPPGTLDGGDVMRVGDHFYIGISGRTNREGAEQLIGILQGGGLTGSTVPLRNMLHLKTGVSCLEENTLLVSGEFREHREFKKFNRIAVHEDEAYAANSLWVNGTVLVPAGHPGTKRKIAAAGYATLEVDVSEFRKLDGGLSCLSLRF